MSGSRRSRRSPRGDWGWLGRALTVVALLFGAQFWYDLLRRLVGIRTLLTTGGSAAG